MKGSEDMTIYISPTPTNTRSTLPRF